MKFNDFLNEAQLDELGLVKGIGSALKGLKAGGLRGASAGYKSAKLRSKGTAHASRIVNNIKSEFEQIIGGGGSASYQDLVNFLEELGLSELESIPNPAGANELNSLQIDKIINDAVKKNYPRIVAAQKGRSLPQKSAQIEPTLEPEQPAASTPAPTAPEIKAPPVSGNIAAIVKAYSILDAKEREELKKQLEIVDDQERLATGTNESKLEVTSKFLGIKF